MCKIEMDTADIIKMASEAAAKAALEFVEKKKQEDLKKWHDKRLFNTRLLLKNYRSFNEHINNALFEQEKFDDYTRESAQDILDLMWQNTDKDIEIESIKQSVKRTKIIITHVNMMLDVYEKSCLKSSKEEDHRKWRVTFARFLSEEIHSVKDIAKQEHIDKRTVYRDIDAAVEDISVLIFGINGLNADNITCH